VRNGRFSHLRVWIDGGDHDPFRDADAAFVTLLRAHNVDVTYHVWPGSHHRTCWHAHMAAYLSFYARELATCR
jgi:acetyl esterase/lipase